MGSIVSGKAGVLAILLYLFFKPAFEFLGLLSIGMWLILVGAMIWFVTVTIMVIQLIIAVWDKNNDTIRQ
jgi:hypothetical protein